MAIVRFWQKPGCKGNARQVAALVAAGHDVEVHDLLSFPWTGDALRPFFGGRPVSEWFNPSAPRITSGDVVPSSLDEAAAMALLLEDPLLIRRPLLESGDRREAGFDAARIDAWLGLRTSDGAPIPAPEGCVPSDGRCER
jgi:nitrogenase-associated protein